MVDTLLDFSPSHVVSTFKILKTNLFLKNNTLLESGLIENMAQTVALHTGYDFFLKDEVAPTGYIGSIKKVDILHEFNGVTMVAVKVYNATEVEIASGEMKTVIANQ